MPIDTINKKLSPNLILLAGFHSISTRLRSDPSSIHQLYISTDRKDKRIQDASLIARQSNVEVKFVSNKKLKNLFGKIRNQGIVAIAKKKVLSETLGELVQNINVTNDGFYPTLIFLDGVTDPRNLGAILRTADSVGAGGVIAPINHSAPLNDVAIKTSCGGSDTVSYVKVPSLVSGLEVIQDIGYQVFGTESQASQNLFSSNLKVSTAFVFGDEGGGLKTKTREYCDHLIKLPMRGSVDSLNVSVACAVSLFEDLRQKQTYK